jgi:hypothetical protein
MPLEHVPQRSAIWLRGAAFAANYVKNSLIPDSDRLRAEAPGIGLRPLQRQCHKLYSHMGTVPVTDCQ